MKNITIINYFIFLFSLNIAGRNYCYDNSNLIKKYHEMMAKKNASPDDENDEKELVEDAEGMNREYENLDLNNSIDNTEASDDILSSPWLPYIKKDKLPALINKSLSEFIVTEDEEKKTDINSRLKFEKPSLYTKIKYIFSSSKNYLQSKYKIPNLIGCFPDKIQEIIEQLKKLSQGTKTKIFNRLILYGPPGNGKTTLAKQIAQLSECEILSYSGPTIVSSYLGSGPQNISDYFLEAKTILKRTKKPVIIFIDEIDAIASGNFQSEFRAEHKAATQALWISLDECKNIPYIYFICTTNNIETLNKTFLDRFGSNIIEIPNPTYKIRRNILEFYFEKNNLTIDDNIIHEIANNTNNFSARALEDLVNEIYKLSKNDIVSFDEEFIYQLINHSKSKFKNNKSDIQPTDSKLRKLTDITILIVNVFQVALITNHIYKYFNERYNI